jgi:ketosteroid isomerase-like protein
MTDEQDTQALLAAERERCRAISEKDWDALAPLLADDLTHTHMNGLVHRRDEYFEHVQRRPRRVERGDLSVRVYGDTAVMNGRMFNHNTEGEPPVEAEAMQVWVRRGDAWQQAAFQASRVGMPPQG